MVGPETPVEFVSSPQKMVMPDPLTGRVICGLAAVVSQVVTKAWAGGASDAPETVTRTIRRLLPSSKTLSPVAVTVTVWTPFPGAVLKASVEDPGIISNSSGSPPAPIP